MPDRHTTTELTRFTLDEPARLRGDLPPWLAAFVQEAQRETDALRENGAEQGAAARLALLKKLAAAPAAHLDTEIDIHEAAREKGVCEETIRRAVRDGRIPDRRANPRGRHRVRRGDLNRVADSPGRSPGHCRIKCLWTAELQGSQLAAGNEVCREPLTAR
jgi:hypothetical protein